MEMNLNPTPVRGSCTVLPGHITVNEKWRGTPLVHGLKGRVPISFADDLGIVDFCPAHNVVVVYVHEADMVAGTIYRTKLVKLRRADHAKGIVLADKTPTSSQYFKDLQKFVVLEMGLKLVPVISTEEAAAFLVQLVNTANSGENKNPFLRPVKSPPDALILATVQTIPKLGEVKARKLLERFRSVKEICNATKEDLAAVVGNASSEHVWNFFRRT